MVVRFAILMQWGRVGSNLVVHVINQSRTASLANERFNTIRDLDAQFAFYAEHYQFAAERPSPRLLGIKENVMALADRALFARRLREDGVRVIRMRRDNLVKAAVSQIRAETYAAKMKADTGQARWAIRLGETPLGPSMIDPALLLTRVGMMDRARSALMDLFAPDEVLDLEYGALLADLPDTVSRLRRFLDIPDDGRFRVPFVKATPDDLAEVIVNLDEVAAALADTPYAAMLPGGLAAPRQTA